MTIKELLIQNFNNKTFSGKTAKQIFVILGITKAKDKDAMRKIFDELEKESVIGRVEGKFYAFEDCGYIKGTIKTHERGFAFFTPQDKTLGELFIPSRSLNGAFQGDTVLAVKVVGKRGSTDEGEVVKVLERGKPQLVGTYYAERTYGFVVPDDRGFTKDIFIAGKNSQNAKTGSKVVCNIISYSDGKSPEGEIVEVLGFGCDIATEESAILVENKVKQTFNEETINYLRNIPDCVSEKDKFGRLDLTNELIITIDGDDSRDFDDAISLTIKDNGNYQVGVHIADVTHYVRPNTPIDSEALERATSIYFPDRVIPMLPEKLSNGICSLNQGVERLTISCLAEVTPSGEVVTYDIKPSVIKSKYRMTYKKVQGIIDGDKDLRKEYLEIVDLIDNCYKLSRVLRANRKKLGSIDIETKESYIFVVEDKIVLDKRLNTPANQLIEEFMLLANTIVARHCYYLDIPFVYRTHEKPTDDKIKAFIEFLKGIGIKLSWNEKNYHPQDFNALLEKIKQEPYYNVVNSVLLRSMQKAKYTPDNIGHFGLAFSEYCHFTSPIRRYPDLMVHRILKSVIKDYNSASKYEELVGEVSEHSSIMERKADEVERQVDKLYVTAYMYDFIGEEFVGVISGVTSFGIFVELENSAEGLIRLENLPRGYYTYDEKNFTLSSGNNIFKLGDKINVIVENANISTREIDFVLSRGKDNFKK